MNLRLVLILTYLSLVVLGCSSKHTPAPVVSLSTKIASEENLTEIVGSTYIVQPGDTLFAIAFYSGNDYRDLAKLNSIQYPYKIAVGQKIKLEIEPEIIINKNKGIENIAQNSDKITVDRNNTQGYGSYKNANHREKQNNKPEASVKPYNELDWIWPANGTSTVATVGSDGSKRGLDIKGKSGARITAAADGKVVYAGNALKGYGNLIIIKHNDEYLSAYAHNQSILVGEQSFVKQGQQIATMGNSGASEVMLHFEIRKRGKSIDPFKYLPSR